MVAMMGHWAVPGVLVVGAVIAGFGAPGEFGWQRAVIPTEPWRLLTAHFVHLDIKHLLLNLGGLVVLWALVGRVWSSRVWALITVMCALAVTLGLLVVPGLAWYVGLSGLLHGMLAAGAIGLWRAWRPGAIVLIAFVCAKTAVEFVYGTATGLDAVVEAHWLGAAAGGVAGIMAAFARRRTLR